MPVLIDPIYDEDSDQQQKPSQGKAKTGPNLHVLENQSSGNSTNSAASQTQSTKYLNNGQLSSAENSATPANVNTGLYNPVDKSRGLARLRGRSKGPSSGTMLGRTGHFFWGSRSRKIFTTGGGAAGGTGIGLTILLIVASGPAQLIQLSEVLQKPFGNMNNTLGSSFSSEISHFTGAPEDISSTRLSTLGQFYIKPIVSQLNKVGIKYVENSAGHLSAVEINPKTFGEYNEDFANLNTLDEQKAWLADKIPGISPGDITQLPDGTLTVVAEGSQFSTSIATGLIKGTNQLASGDVLGAINTRVFLKKYGLATLFHPLRAVANAAAEKVASKAANTPEQADDDVDAATEAAIGGETTTFGVDGLLGQLKSSLSDFAKSDAGKLTTGALFLQDAYCEAYNSVGNVISFDRLGIVLPSALEAIRFISIGDQVRAGQDVSSQEVGETVGTLTNPQGQSIWDSQPLQVLEGNLNPSGPDLSTDYSQAFSSNTTASAIESTLSAHGITALACSTPAKLIAAAAGITLLIASIPTDGGSTALIIFAGEFGDGALATGGAMLAIKNIIEGTLKDNAAVPEALSGPVGGGIAAYGARAAAGISAITDGGVALNQTQTQQVNAVTERQTQAQFQSEPFFSRVFNIDNYQSLLGKLAESISPKISTDISNFASGILNVGQVFSHGILGILPKASAADVTYNWGFPEYGIPPGVLNTSDPTMQNPYENASIVAGMLNNPATGPSYISRAETCFGVDISNTSGVWDVDPIANFDVNPQGNDTQGNSTGPSYASGDCDDTSGDSTASVAWERIILFVLDTRAMQDGTCFMGDAQSCSEVGFN